MIMTDFIEELDGFWPWSVTTACGWYIDTYNWTYEDDIIYSDIFIPLNNGTVYKQPASWYKDGTPTDLQQYPTRYYTRLVVFKDFVKI